MNKMKIITFGLAIMLSSFLSFAGLTISPFRSLPDESLLIEQIETPDLKRAEINHSQTFHLYNGNKEVGALIQGRAWINTTQPVCFIAWSRNGKVIDQFIETIGHGDWETVGCHEIYAVGVISQQNEDHVKIATIYQIELPANHNDGYGIDYYVLDFNLSTGKIIFDKGLTEKFQNSGIMSIAEMRVMLKK